LVAEPGKLRGFVISGFDAGAKAPVRISKRFYGATKVEP
jgi:hypothetical protein